MDVVYFLRVVWFLASFLSYALPALVFVVYLFLFSLIFKLVKLLAGLSQLIPQKVWSFRAWRKLFPEWFGISALGENHFPKGLAFPRSAKIISRKVWHFRAWRKSFHESLDNLTHRDVYLGQGKRIKKIREIIKQKSINKRIFDNKTMKYQSK